ncbi:MAG: ABC transporter permease [Acidobacteria bacterium]|nr:ABC transporter permease [Acidobacteriota bacterium]
MKTAHASAPADAVWTIESGTRRGFVGQVREYWRFRYAARFFAVRSIQILYKRTQLGWLWIILRPVLPVVVGTFVFGEIMNLPSLGLPYFLFNLAGTTCWTAFDRSLGWATRSLERNRHLVTKIYFPRAILPPASTAGGLMECVVQIGMLVIAVCYFRSAEGRWYVAPARDWPLAALALGMALGLAVAFSWFTAIWQAHARDTRFALGWVLSFWSYFTPVVYPLEHIPAKYRFLALMNPLTSVVEAFRASTIGAGVVSWWGLAWAATVLLVSGIAGWHYFLRAEGQAADRL